MTEPTGPILTLTTDFGEQSPYVAAMKGAILSINPAARILDLSHEIRPQDVRHAAFFLANAIPYYPPGPIHVVVVDPGVGSERALLYVEIEGHRLLAPDNGCWTELATAAGRPTVIRLAESRFWRPAVSATFHGRDILAPVAAHLSLGVRPREFGPLVTDWVRLELPSVEVRPEGVFGRVLFVDRFGNLITNLPGSLLRDASLRLFVGDQEITQRARTYADRPPGTLLALESSFGTIELAVVQGSAADRLKAREDTPIRALRRSSVAYTPT